MTTTSFDPLGSIRRFRDEDMFRERHNSTPDQSYIDALRLCIQKDTASVSFLQRSFPFGYVKSCKIIDWMAEKKYIIEEGKPPRYKVAITQEQFEKEYGEKDENDIDEEDEFIEEDTAYDKLMKELESLKEGIEKKEDIAAVSKSANELYKVNNEAYSTFFSEGFDMQIAIKAVPDLRERTEDILTEMQNTPERLGEWESEEDFENICMDVIEAIVKMNRKWGRQEAIHEAAEQLVAIKYTFQSGQAYDVHARVLREFMIATDDEYELLRKQIFDE